MCGNLDTPSSSEETKTMECLTGAVGNNCSFSVLLEFAADNDVEGFQRYMIASDVSLVGEVGLWYGCRKSSKQMVVEQRTPLMIAARYGSVDVVKLILSLSEVDVNLSCGPDKRTALHCAASGGSIGAVEVVKLLLLAAADPCVTDAYGCRPSNVIVAPWNMPQIKVALEELLNNHDPVCLEKLHDSGSSDVKITAVTCENARRRDPRKFHYSCAPCPDFRKGSCKQGDLCEYAHGVFESWLHPAQYRTRICKDGTTCQRRVCFFAHRPEELRPLYLSSGLGIQSPQSAASSVITMDKIGILNLLPGSPSALTAISVSPFSPAMSPSANVISQAPTGWPQHVPTLHLSGSNLQGSRLRSSLNAKDMSAMELNMSRDFEVHQRRYLSNLSCFSQPHLGRKSSNLDGLFSTEVSSTRCPNQVTAMPILSPVLSAKLEQQQRVLSPIETNIFSPKNDHPLLQSAFDASLSERISTWNVEPLSPLNSLLSASTNLEKQQQSLHNLSTQELGYKLSNDLESKGVTGSLLNSWPKRETPNCKVDWPIQEDEFSQFHKSCSILHHGMEPAVSLVQSMVKESPSVPTTLATSSRTLPVEGSNSNFRGKLGDHEIFLALCKQLQLDKIMA
ncbi:zinc finger CCCH domain-containing protein 56 isoform X3 [Gossypium hirsutum]|uniref:Zinc finger CCCH domain-containing protein 56 isoform X3 n=1 Tax=Gossypium hirsutum TaxID=3635 RepID=A0ABM3C3B3_GOSHI|nr:zinc finger CCCH domain-containing protein 56-like isoform X3 [Gossypium hirsutum]